MDVTHQHTHKRIYRLIVYIVCCVAVLGVLLYGTRVEGLQGVDLNVVAEAALDRTHALSTFFMDVSILGDLASVVVITGLIALALAYRKQWVTAAGLIVSVGSSSIIAYVVKTLVERPRPVGMFALLSETTYSFPSGHATAVVALYGFLFYLLMKSKAERVQKIVGGSAIGLFIVLIGVSRVYIGVHYPSDILGGYTVGLLGVFLGVITMYALHIWLHHLNHSATRKTKSR